MNNIIEEVAKNIVESKEWDSIVSTQDYVNKKCRGCMHYYFRERDEETPWHRSGGFGHVCDYGLCEDDPRIFELEKPKRARKMNTTDLLFDYQQITVEDRIELGECEFKDFPEARDKPWHEQDDEWDLKYLEKYFVLMEKHLLNSDMDKQEVYGIIIDELEQLEMIRERNK
jgi:hypothetical protein